MRTRSVIPTEDALNLFGRDGPFLGTAIRLNPGGYSNFNIVLNQLQNYTLSPQYFQNITDLCVNYQVRMVSEKGVFAVVFKAVAKHPFFQKLKRFEIILYIDRISEAGEADALMGEKFFEDERDIDEVVKELMKPMPALEIARISVNGLALPWDRRLGRIDLRGHYYYPIFKAPGLRDLTIETDGYSYYFNPVDTEEIINGVTFPTFESLRVLRITRNEFLGAIESYMKKLVALFPNLDSLFIKSYDYDYRPTAKSSDHLSICEPEELKYLELPWLGGGDPRGLSPANELEGFVHDWLKTGANKLEQITFSGRRRLAGLTYSIGIQVHRVDAEPGWELLSWHLDEEVALTQLSILFAENGF
ncbi:hypothetical protein TWF703_006321 [Orbilia oligospora]|uniref:Uncharacterized protein n=1 Tax=Orbilia oligospora TaxID=2813651 RepID=A0A7C8JP56_ORBOL|nr:hypothetical protein TWF703_006321 [Orbilia oligospora]